nr:zinc finger SWIM domain-containing protein 7 [Ipomoea batatas]
MSTSLMVAEKIWNDIESTRSGNFSVFCRLHFLFGKNFERASRVVDQRGVKRICGQPSGRSVFQVVGESKKKEEYLCFPEHYCACYSFFYDVVNRGEQLCVRFLD